MEEPIDHSLAENPSEQAPSPSIPVAYKSKRGFRDWLNKRKLTLGWLLITLAAFGVGSFGGYRLGLQQSSVGMNSNADAQEAQQSHTMAEQVNPSKGYQIPVRYGMAGPKLLSAGGINYSQFEQVYAQVGKPLTDEQKAILTKGSNQLIVINAQNAYFLLNFFWALGLTNQNTILTKGPMMAQGKEQVGNFASTGGWTIGAKAPTDLYAGAPIISLTSEQQALLENVASMVYRPCCNNPTQFPDCNHGMAMLGLLELMASQNATEDQMFQAAKYVNAFWYPQQTMELAAFFQAVQKVDFNHTDARQMVSAKYASGSGFQVVHNYLASNNLLQQAPSQGGSCGVQ